MICGRSWPVTGRCTSSRPTSMRWRRRDCSLNEPIARWRFAVLPAGACCQGVGRKRRTVGITRRRCDPRCRMYARCRQHLRENGYHTVSLGKIYHSSTDDPQGWTDKPWRPSGPSYVTEASKNAMQPHPRQKGRVMGPATENGGDGAGQCLSRRKDRRRSRGAYGAARGECGSAVFPGSRVCQTPSALHFSGEILGSLRPGFDCGAEPGRCR